MIPVSEAGFQEGIIKGFWIVLAGVCIVWMIGNFDVVFGFLGLR